MYCNFWNSIYLKANGDIPCWCDAGESVVMVPGNQWQDFFNDCVNGEKVKLCRALLKNGKIPWENCNKCCCLSNSNRQINCSKDGSIFSIEQLQVEASYLCLMGCIGCVHLYGLTPVQTPPYNLSFELWKKIISSLLKNNCKVNMINFCGRGESTMSPFLTSIIKYTAEFLKETRMHLETNGQREWKKEYSMLTMIICSVDGASQEIYGKYRKNGNFSKAIQFMQKSVESKVKTHWKYILFNTNDSTEELKKAVELSYKIGTHLHFVFPLFGSFDKKVMPSQLKEPEQVLERIGKGFTNVSFGSY